MLNSKINRKFVDMKLDKLLTLSQFVSKYTAHSNDVEDYYTNTEIIEEAEKQGYLIAPFILNKIVQYNDFLKQPLKKEMFVNEVDIPLKSNYGLDAPEFNSKNPLPQECYKHDLDKYEAEEKKVIFEGFSIDKNFIGINSLKERDCLFYGHREIIFIQFLHEWAISDLIQELADVEIIIKLKNVEL